MKIIALLLAFILCFCIYGSAVSENAATPTDLEEEQELIEIDDDDWGDIDIEFERQVYIDGPIISANIGDTVVLTAILVNFKESDIVQFEWQYTTDLENWHIIEGANKQNYDFILTEENYYYWYRVRVIVEG